MSKWLEVFGLKDSDIVLKNMDQAQAVAAFEAGIGDAVVLWAPHIYTGLGKGWKIAANTKTSGGAQPIVLIAEKEFSEKNPELMAKFLRVYLRGINLIKKDGEQAGTRVQEVFQGLGRYGDERPNPPRWTC